MVELDTKAIEEYLTIGMTLNHKTFILGKKYKVSKPLEYHGVNGEASVDRVVRAYEECVLDACKGKKNILLQLSGGKDSRLIAAVLKKYGIDFSAVVYGDGEKCMDVRVAKLVAKLLKIPITSFTNVKDVFSKEAALAIVKANHGLRAYHGLAMQYHFRKFLRQFDLVLDGYYGNYLFDAKFYFKYPEHLWMEMLEKQYYFVPCCLNAKSVLLNFISEYYNKSLEEAFIMEVNKCIALDFNAVQSWGIQCKTPINQKLIDAVYTLPYHNRTGIILAQKMLKQIDKKLIYLPYASFGILPLIVPYKYHLGVSKVTSKYFPNWKCNDPSSSQHYGMINFKDYIKTFPDFVRRLSILQTDKSLGLLKGAARSTTMGLHFKDRLMNFKLWSDINEIY